MISLFIHVRQNPAIRLALVFILGFGISFLAAHTALEQNKLGITFQPGMTLPSAQGPLTLEPLDLMHEPGELTSHSELNRFYERQDLLAEITSRKQFTLTHDGQDVSVTSSERTLLDLPVLFWIQIIVGLGALFISGWLWALRPRDLPSALFAFSGFSTFISALPSAVYTTRELAIPSTTFKILETLNAWGASLFGISMIALFLLYPAKLKRRRLWMVFQVPFFLIWTISYSLQLTPDWANISLIIVVLMACLCIAIGAQFFATKGNPKSRASLTWLGLSVIIGAGSFVAFNTVPLVMGLTPLNQGYAFLFFLIIYLGLAAGITQFRLFEVGDWAFRFLFYALGAAGLVLLDAGLIYVLELDRLPALGIALLVIGFAYLPLRDSVMRFFQKRNLATPHEFLPEALNVVFAPSETERTIRWITLLKNIFDPLEINFLQEPITDVEIRDDGLSLVVPSVAASGALKLSYPMSGRGLFSPKLRDFTKQMIALIQKAESSREAYDRGAIEERLRMAQDLHDDLGSRLLSGLYSADDKHRPVFKAALADVRSIVGEMSHEQVSLSRLLAEARHEASQRLSETSIMLEWLMLPENTNDEIVFHYRQHKAVKSALREIVSNVIQHSKASRLEVEIKQLDKTLHISLRDNGVGFSMSSQKEQGRGYGIKNLQRRLSELEGSVAIESNNNGTRILLVLPLLAVTDKP